MKVLVACEESQAVCIEFRKLGIEAFSCDLEDCSGGHPEWHYKGDVIPILNGGIFQTQGGVSYWVNKWDMIIAFPPCTHLAVSGSRHFAKKRESGEQQQGIDFFKVFTDLECAFVAIENPVGIMSTFYKKPSQIFQPYQFGDAFEKKTCLWLKGLPLLENTNVVEPPPRTKYDSGKSMPTWYADLWKLPKKERAKLRSRTFPGIAKAMAAQWTEFILNNNY